MAVYDYECINKQGELIRGQINGENISSSLERLKSMGFSVVDLKERKTQVKSSLFTVKESNPGGTFFVQHSSCLQ